MITIHKEKEKGDQTGDSQKSPSHKKITKRSFSKGTKDGKRASRKEERGLIVKKTMGEPERESLRKNCRAEK